MDFLDPISLLATNHHCGTPKQDHASENFDLHPAQRERKREPEYSHVPK
jgi:hypothetical protein